MSDALERVTITIPDTVAPPGHDAAMIALVDSKAAPAATDRPAWLPEKFKTPEDMAASYAALETKLGTPAAAVAAPVTPAVADTAAPVAAQADAAVVKAGLNMAELNTEFATSGSLSEASYTKLAAVGFDKATVDSYVAGQQALVAQFENDVKSATPGGPEKFPEMVEWAKVNMSEPQIAEFNAAVSSGNKDRARLAVAGLGAAFSKDVGSEPSLQNGRQGAASAGDVFESIAQMQVAMSSKEYKTDPAFRAKVQAKLGRSSIM